MRIMGKNITSNIFDASNKRTLKKWEEVHQCTVNLIPQTLMLIHTVRNVHAQGNKSQLVTQNAENVLNSWDVISTSLIEFRSKYIKSQWAKVGLLLAVPPQNIIGTFSEDVSFQNHAGVKEKNSFALTENYFNGTPKILPGPKGKERFEHLRKNVLPNQNYAHITTPEDLIVKSLNSKYNEVLVVGKPNINIHAGFPPTGRIIVCGIYHQVSYQYGEDADDKRLLQTLQVLNPEVPVIRQEVY